MVEVLLESSGQEIAVADNVCQQGETLTECPSSDFYGPTAVDAKFTPIQEFYNNQAIFITGGTGFVGKLLIEKLLRDCHGITFIYVLVRPKKGKDVHQRIEELFNDALFHKLKEQRPKFRHQIVAIPGDCSLPDLGMSASDKATVAREVSIVFHVAATLRFDERINLAVPINVRSVKDALNLSKEMPQLKAFVLVSTAYANCPQKLIQEKFYDPPVDADKLIAMVECMDEKLIDEITPKLLGVWPNTYTFTKAVAENIVKKNSGDLPVGIFRPAIIVSTYKEPLSGWIDNLYGPTGVAAGAGTGVLRTLHCDEDIQANLVPGDLTVSALISSAWDIAERRRSKSTQDEQIPDIPIYNYVCKDNPITFQRFKQLCEEYGMHSPSTKAIWYYSFRNNKHKAIHLFYVYFMHLLPALLVDAATVCIGKQPRMLKLYKKVHKFMDVLNYFTMHEWDFTNDHVVELWRKMTPEDQQIFYCDMASLPWEPYFCTYIRGIRTHLLKDPPETLPEARVKWQRLYWSHQVLKLILAYTTLRVMWWALSSLLLLSRHL